MHQQHNGNDSKWMWAVMLICAVPFVFLVLASGFSRSSLFVLIGVGVLMAVGHYWLMRGERADDPANNDQHKH